MILNGGSSLRGLLRLVDGVISFSSQNAVDEAGRILVNVARKAWLSRNAELVDQTVRTILSLPLSPQVHGVARYYQTLIQNSANLEETGHVLRLLADRTGPEYKPRVVLGLGAYFLGTSQLTEAARAYIEAAGAAARDPLSRCSALRGLALVKSFQGDHAGSLADLERLFPVMRSFATSYPEDYRYYLNNLAYELGQVGRIDEARATINVALRSPNADRFPDWAETAQELDTMQRRVFLPLVFAIGSPAAALAVPADIAVPKSDVAATRIEQVQPEASAPAQPESQPDVQISAARKIAPRAKRNLKRSIRSVLAKLACRRIESTIPQRRTLQPTFETRGWVKSPRARAPPFHYSLF